ncbi:MAG: hypothetical protein IT210_07740 [Armatimonadetes bacterium]|nr:hypothetical protein [Armatimonadota bacterium]
MARYVEEAGITIELLRARNLPFRGIAPGSKYLTLKPILCLAQKTIVVGRKDSLPCDQQGPG